MADLSITAANVQPGTNCQVLQEIAGATITAGQTLYKDSADSNKLKLAQADDADDDDVVGIALCGGASGQPITYASSGPVTLGSVLTVGELYILSDTAGGIKPVGDLASTQYVSYLGVAESATSLVLAIDNSGIQRA